MKVLTQIFFVALFHFVLVLDAEATPQHSAPPQISTRAQVR
ncbi:MAG: hypothetical protein AB7K68_03950 [Bacteriovoracia bacterium]